MEQNNEDKKLIGKLTIHFSQDGQVLFYPVTDQPELLAEKFNAIVRILHDNPHLIGHAFRACEKHSHN